MHIILTPNQRMARYLSQKNENELVFPLDEWLKKTYLDMTNSPSLLTENEELILWEDAITQSEVGSNLPRIRQTAQLARDAFYLSHQWKLNIVKGEGVSLDVSAYLDWSHFYLLRTEKRRWIEKARLPDKMRELWQADPNVLEHFPTAIRLIGFTEYSPQLVTFFDALTALNIKVGHQSLLKETHAYSKRLRVDDTESEYRLAAAYAKLFLKEQHNTLQTMAIVVPKLSEERDKIVRILKEVLPAESFNVSAPLSLASYPMIEAALLILSLPKLDITTEDFSQVLGSAFLGKAFSEMSERARLDIRCRKMNEPALNWQTILSILDSMPHLNHFKTALVHFISIQSQFKGKKPSHEWYKLIQSLLQTFEWPGERTLNFAESRMKACFESQLKVYHDLDPVLGKHTYWQAVTRIRELVVETPFVPYSGDAPIQVLGILEALGLPFNKLWVTGLHRDAWPEEPRPNPFLPISLQRLAGIPRSSPQREYRVAKEITDQLCKAASEIIFSYPTTVKNEESHPSPLIMHFPEVTLNALSLVKPESYIQMHRRIRSPKQYLRARNQLAPPLEISEKNLGGTSMLKLQAICPFRAFAAIRLKAESIPLVTLGFTPAERGEIIHAILHAFYREIPDQKTLNAYSETALRQQVHRVVLDVLKQWQKQKPKTLTARYLNLESERISVLIHRLVELDKLRSAFKVYQLEKEITISLSHLHLKVRIDRIDQLESGEEILIDYKTGDVSLKHWFSERSEEPQLPLYSITRESSVAGLVFAVIRPEKTQYVGLVKEEAYIRDVKTIEKLKSSGAEATWEAQHSTWQNSLSQLANDFSQGIANIDPKNGEASCRYCDFKPLCRVDIAVETISEL